MTGTGQAAETDILDFLPAFINPLLPPSNLTAVGSSRSHSIKLTWTDNTKNETGYVVERAHYQDTDFIRIGVTDPNVTTFYDSNINTAYFYTYRVCALRKIRQSAYSNTSSAACMIPPHPADPTDLVAVAISSTSIKLTWKDNATDETNYWVYRGLTQDNVYDLVTDQLGPNTQEYTVTGLDPNTTYWFSVMAVNGMVSSNISNKVSATTPDPANVNPVLNGPPGGVVTHYFDLTWSYDWPSSGSSNDKYVLQYRSASTGNAWVELGTYAACPGCEFRFSPIYQEVLPDATDIGKVVDYRVGADANGIMRYSNIVSLTVPYLDIALYPNSDNMIMKDSTDAAKQNTVYTNGYNGVGTNYVSTGMVNSYITFASALRFDDYGGYPLSTFIQGRTIDSAQLILTPANLPIPGTTYAVQPFASAYNPSTLTYANCPSYRGSPLTINTPPSLAGQAWIFDVKNIIQGWASGTFANHGVILRDYGVAVDPQGNILHLGFTIFFAFDNHSLETATSLAQRPRLELIIK